MYPGYALCHIDCHIRLKTWYYGGAWYSTHGKSRMGFYIKADLNDPLFYLSYRGTFMNKNNFTLSKNEYIARKKIVFTKIKENAVLYERLLANKEFLIIAEGKTYPVEFRRRDFAHLCGVEKRISAEEFEKRAAGVINHKLDEMDFGFSKRFPIETAEIKLSILSDLIKSLYLGGELIIEPITKSERDYSEAIYIETENKKGSLCFCEDHDQGYMFPKSNRPGPKTNFRGYEEIKHIDYILVRSLGDSNKFRSLTKGTKKYFFKYLKKYNVTNPNIDIRYFKNEYENINSNANATHSSEIKEIKFELKSSSGHTLKFSAKGADAATLGDVLRGSIDKMLDSPKEVNNFDQNEDYEQ